MNNIHEKNWAAENNWGGHSGMGSHSEYLKVENEVSDIINCSGEDIEKNQEEKLKLE
jgi:uncharacterized protein YukE